MQGLQLPLNKKLPSSPEGGGSLCYQDAWNVSIWSPRANSPHESHQGRLRAIIPQTTLCQHERSVRQQKK
jgi:hypothetical protein